MPIVEMPGKMCIARKIKYKPYISYGWICLFSFGSFSLKACLFFLLEETCIFMLDRTVMSVQLSKFPTQTNSFTYFFVMRTLKIYSLSNFKTFSLLLLASISPCCEINLLNSICLTEVNLLPNVLPTLSSLW